MRMQAQFLASLSGLRTWHCLKLQHRSKMWLRSHAAVAVNFHMPQVQLSKAKKKKEHGRGKLKIILEMKSTITGVSAVVHWAKDPVLSLQWLGFDPRPRNFHMSWAKPKKIFFQVQSITKIENLIGVPLWLSGLRIQHCHCSGSGHSSGAGLIPGPGTSTCHGHSQKPKSKQKTLQWMNGCGIRVDLAK